MLTRVVFFANCNFNCKLQGYTYNGGTGHTSTSPECEQLGKANCLLLRGITCLLCWLGGAAVGEKSTSKSVGLFVRWVRNCAWVGGGRCTSSSLPLVSTPRHSKIWGINNAVTVSQSSCQPDTLYDQLERLKQVAVTELYTQTLLRNTIICKSFAYLRKKK